MGTFAKAIRQIASRSGSRSVKLNGNLYAQAGRILADSRAGVNKSPAGIYTYIAGHEVNEIVDLPVPLTLEDGYQIQIEAEKHLMKEFGWKKCGFKVGATSEAIQNTLGIKTPFYGTIFNDRLYRKDLGVDCMSCGIEIDIIDSPDHSNQWCSFGAFSKSEHNCRGIEAEFGFILKQDILQREADYTWEEVAEYVDEIVPCIEICGSRFEVAVPPGNAPLVIADGAGNSAFLVCNAHEHGPQMKEWITKKGSELKVETMINYDQNQLIKGSGMAVLGHPIHSLTWLANALNREYIQAQDNIESKLSPWRKLEQGDFVATGALSGLMSIEANNEVVVDFQSFGALEMIMHN